MRTEVDVAAWERAARTIDALADGLEAPAGLPLPDDRYARALGDVPARSDELAARAHRAAVDELRGLAERIRGRARATARADDAGARTIEEVL